MAGAALIGCLFLMLALEPTAALDPNLQEGSSFYGDHYDNIKILANYYTGPGTKLEGWTENHRRGLESLKKKDYRAVLNRFQPLADKGDPHASAFVAYLYREGLGPKLDTETTYAYTMRSAEQGIPVAQYLFGDMIETGYGTGRRSAEGYKAAAELYRAAAKQGLAPAQSKLAVLCFEGRGVPKDPVEAHRWALRAAEQGDASSQTLLGELYYFGDGVPKDYARALDWYTKASDHSIRARYMLGLLYESGAGTAKDPVKAVDWYRRAAEGGRIPHPPSAVRLGYLYEKGIGVKQDLSEAARWYGRIADIAYSVAGNLYGREAERWVADAQVRLSILYWGGSGVPRDYARAADLAARAAGYGSADGQWVIGLLTLNGDGVARDVQRAAAWLRLAAAQGHEASKAKLKELEQSGAIPP